MLRGSWIQRRAGDHRRDFRRALRRRLVPDLCHHIRLGGQPVHARLPAFAKKIILGQRQQLPIGLSAEAHTSNLHEGCKQER